MSHSWEDQAKNWIAWARKPGHDVFPLYAPSFFEGIVPAAHGLTLEIGCGEGRVARELAGRGHNVIALDGSQTLVRAARDVDARSRYLVSSGPALPFADATFQTVVAYNSLQTMAELTDMQPTVREAGRILAAGGHFCLCIAHPMTDLSFINEASGREDPDASYFENRRVAETVSRNGLEMTFYGWTYTLQDYVRALEDAGFVIERMREPLPIAKADASPDVERFLRVPLFLFVVAARRA